MPYPEKNAAAAVDRGDRHEAEREAIFESASGGRGPDQRDVTEEPTREQVREKPDLWDRAHQNGTPERPTHDPSREGGELSPTAAMEKKRHKSSASQDDQEDRGVGVFLSSRLPWFRRRKVASRREESHESSDEISESASLEEVVSEMFGSRRKESSHGYKLLHRGVVWRDLRVYGSGLGTAYQRTDLDALLSIPRAIWDMLTFWRWRQRMAAQAKTVGILHGFSGCLRPGEMMLVLGRPGSGCTTMLRALGNQRAGYSKVEGSVTYGGTDAADMAKHYRSEVIYNPENDAHCAALSVRRVLSFAISTRTPSSASRLEGETRSQYRRTFLKAVSKLFWIEGVLDTKIGNDMIRGISGGEKRRVSIAETMVTRASTQCWDNSTRGLDASTAKEYVTSLRSMTDHSQCSTIVSLYQASENLFKQFDKLMVIIAGRCAFFGKASEARGYFESLGFECPPRWTTPDFVTTVNDVNARRVKKGWENRIPRSDEDFEKAYNTSSVKEAAMKDMEEFERYLREDAGSISARDQQARKLRKNYTLPVYHQAILLAKQQFFILIGNKVTLLCKYLIVFFLAFIVGSLFYNLPLTTDGLFTRGGVLFYVILFNCLMAMAELSASFENRPIIQKHKVLSMYRPAAFGLAQVIADIPQVFIQVTVFNVVVYFLSHLSRTASQFFISYLFTFIITMVMYSFFRAIGCVCSSLDVATRITGVALQALIVYTGGYLKPYQAPCQTRQLTNMIRILSASDADATLAALVQMAQPIQYAFEALVANEFYNHEFACTPENITPQGPGVTRQHQTCLTQGSEPGKLSINGKRYIQSNFTYSRAHLWRNFGILVAWFLFWVAVTMFGMETQKPSNAGKSVIVYRKGAAPRSVELEMKGHGDAKPNDEEKNKKSATARSAGEAEQSKTNPQRGEVATEAEQNASGQGDDGSDGSQHHDNPIFTWRNLNYSVPVKGGQKQLLRDVQGYVRPGRLTCMIGASGAGKTTLLNALAQRLTSGSLTGEFLVDGRPPPTSFKRNTGYAQQADIHEPSLTVRESLQFSAYLRRPPSVPLKEKYDYCEKIIDLLELRPLAGAVIGTETSGLDAEQRKRVTIAVELASRPELLLFLDEPTSGLDSLAAFNVARLLRKLTDSGQAVFATIHQPPAVLFEQFDELYLLQAGGRVVYHGELGKDSRTMIDYFEKHGAKKCPPDANPAEYMLEVIGAGDPNYKGKDWADVWANSEECKARSREIEEIINTRSQKEQSQDGQSDTEYAMPLYDQVMAVTKRAFVANWRTPDYAMGKFMLCIFCGLFNTFTFWHVNHSLVDFQSRLFSIFMLIIIAPPLCQQLQPRFLHFRGLYESREAESKVYSWFAVIFAAIVSEIPYALTSGTVYFCCWYFGTFFPRDHFSVGYTWMMTMLFSLYYTGFGQILASWAPNELFASLLIPALITFAISFCGVVVPYRYMPDFWRWWMYWIAPFHYLLEGVLSTISHRVQVKCTPQELARFSPPNGLSCEAYAGDYARKIGGYLGPEVDGLCTMCEFTNGDQWASTFNSFRSNKWRDFFVFLGFVIFNFAMVMLISYLYLIGVPKMMHKIKARRTKEKS